MGGERHRIAQTSRVDFEWRVRIAGLQRRKNTIRGRRKHPHRGQWRCALTGGARFRFGSADGAAVGRCADIDVQASLPIEEELLERMKISVELRPIRKF